MILTKFQALSRVKINSLANLSRVILGLPLSLFLTYFVLKKLSLSDYGAWSLSLAFFSYFSFADCGMTTSVTRFASHYKAQNKTGHVNKVLNTALVFYLLVGFFLLCLLWYFKFPILNLFFKTQSEHFLAIGFVYTLVILMACCDFVFSTFLGVLNGFQRMDITSAVDFLKTLIFTFFAFLLLSFQPRLLSLALAFVFSTLIWSFISFYSCRSIFPQLAFGLNYFDPKLLRKMLKFGIQTHFSSLTMLLHLNLDKFLIGHFLGLEKVAFIDIALKLINQSRLLVSSFISPLLPAAAEKTIILKNKIFVFYQRSFKYVFFVASIVFGTLMAVCPLFIRVWLGPEFGMAALATQILAVGHFVNLLTGPAGSIILAQGNPRAIMCFAIFEGLANLIFSYLGIIYLGFYGVIAGTAASLFLSGTIFVFMAPKYFKK